MAPVPIVAFAAWSGTGKTTFVERVIAALVARGLRVGAVKHSGHDHPIDAEGKDSRRFADAGARVTAFCTPGGSAVFERRARSLAEIASSMRGVDIVVAEGWRSETVPTIALHRRALGLPPAVDLDRCLAVVTDDDDLDAAIPRLGFDDIEGTVDLILRNMDEFTHFDENGRARMVDVGEKPVTRREAEAAGRVLVSRETFELIRSGGMKKGDVLAVAQTAGIMGAKRTSDLIPMCHPITFDGVSLDLSLDEDRLSVEIRARVRCAGRTGVEMEALAAVSVAALTVYDMCKAVQRDIVISDIRLTEKSGGAHGDLRREDDLR